MTVLNIIIVVLAIILIAVGIVLEVCMYDEFSTIFIGAGICMLFIFVFSYTWIIQINHTKENSTNLTNATTNNETITTSSDEYMLAELEDGMYYSANAAEDEWILTYVESHMNKKIYKQIKVKEFSVYEVDNITPHIKITKPNDNISAEIFIPINKN